MAKRQNMAIDFGWGEDDDDMGGPMPMDMFGRPRFSGDFRNKRYIEAYGNYSGGYGPPPRPLLNLPPFRGFAPRPPFPMGRGMLMGPRGPPPRMAHDDQATKYLLRCGVPKESVKNLPSELLKLIEPQYCGLCGYGFDTFSVSRLHYVSKNHLKAQKRWLSQKSETGPQKEVPLKARELYCELCDVHITSKVHAESHYSGKPHRAIVEGRKNPKNPILLQRASEGRLEQLIRREKKHLKVPKASEPSDETPTEAKPIQNELYCDVCKTSVTCAEQMTMHLNGKRHLSKEKQHILKMMKGEITETAVSQDENIETVKEDAQDENIETVKEDGTQETPTEENTGETQRNKSDWGDGAGNWEEN